MTRHRLPVTIAAVSLTLAAPAALAGPAVAAGPKVGPNQSFTGLVNGRPANADVMMACFGPVRPGQTGHPLPHQYLEVILTPGPLPGGFTGSKADHIFAQFVVPTPIPEGVNFKRYDVKVAIPTSFVLPCSGPGTVTFTPLPTSPSAQSEKVSVHYVPQP
jgi:hypothetical protein